MAAIEVVWDATRKRLFITFKDELGNLLGDITGWTARLQGKSKDLNGFPIDVAGTIHGPAVDSTFKWDPLVGAGFPSGTELAGMPNALFTLRARLVDAGGKVDYGPWFEIDYLAKPV